MRGGKPGRLQKSSTSSLQAMTFSLVQAHGENVVIFQSRFRHPQPGEWCDPTSITIHPVDPIEIIAISSYDRYDNRVSGTLVEVAHLSSAHLQARLPFRVRRTTVMTKVEPSREASNTM